MWPLKYIRHWVLGRHPLNHCVYINRVFNVRALSLSSPACCSLSLTAVTQLHCLYDVEWEWLWICRGAAAVSFTVPNENLPGQTDKNSQNFSTKNAAPSRKQSRELSEREVRYKPTFRSTDTLGVWIVLSRNEGSYSRQQKTLDNTSVCSTDKWTVASSGVANPANLAVESGQKRLTPPQWRDSSCCP
jgi:hypothetical protein